MTLPWTTIYNASNGSPLRMYITHVQMWNTRILRNATTIAVFTLDPSKRYPLEKRTSLACLQDFNLTHSTSVHPKILIPTCLVSIAQTPIYVQNLPIP